jgi:hypothetical protein
MEEAGVGQKFPIVQESHELGVAEKSVGLEAEVKALGDGNQPEGRERGEEGEKQE